MFSNCFYFQSFCIDFGTSNSVISYIENNDDDVKNILQIPDELTNDKLIPSTIYFIQDSLKPSTKISDLIPNKHYYIGNTATEIYSSTKFKFQLKHNKYFFYEFKRFLGITSKSKDSYKDFLSKYDFNYEVSDDLIYFLIPIYDIDNNDNDNNDNDNNDNNDDMEILCNLKISIIDLISLYFKGLYYLIKIKTNYIGNLEIITTCPAYFHDLQRSQLKKAIENANFKIYKLYNEPTAASIYYINILKNKLDNNKFIVYDLGGGTIDTTVIEYDEENNICEVIDIDGNNCLGGVDIDNLLIGDIYRLYNIDYSNKKWLFKIKKICEELKIKLSFVESHTIVLENVPIKISDNSVKIFETLKIIYTRHQFNKLINNIIDEMIEPIKKMYEKHQTTNIIFIGGPTQIPLLKSKTLSIIGSNVMENIKLDNELYKTIVSSGGCYMYSLLQRKSNFCLLDIVPMDIGISDSEGKMIVMINKNSKIPTRIEKIFTTQYDGQRMVDLEFYEGISVNTCENTFIGSYTIIGIPPLKKGMVLIKVNFAVSYSGILEIMITGNKNSSDDSGHSFDYKLDQNIKLIPKTVCRELLRKLLVKK